LRRTLAIGYIGTLRRLFGQWDGLIKARYDVVAVQNFYGIGNNTVNDTKSSATYYSSYSDRFYASAGVARNFGHFNHFESGIFFQRIRVNPAGAHYINSTFSADQISVDPAVFAPRQFAGVEAGYRYNNVDNNVYPHKGVRFALGGGYVDDLQQPSRSFLKGTSSLSFYLPLGSAFTLALRAGGATVSNDADYYHLSSLGGNMNLRGYPRERFQRIALDYEHQQLFVLRKNRSACIL
jgi:outer membrane protein assembly factor BamA